MTTSAGAMRPCGDEDELTAAVLLATQPAARLPYVEQRLLARFVEHVDRKVHLASQTDDEWRQVMRRVFRMTAVAGRIPTAQGIGLLATSSESCLLHLRAPVRDRVHVGPAPTADDLELQLWPAGSVVIAVLTETLARTLVLGDGMFRELAADGLPLRRDPGRYLTEHLSRFEVHLAGAVDPDTPVVLAGDERTALEFRQQSALGDRVVAVLPGDTSELPPAALLDLALQRTDAFAAVG